MNMQWIGRIACMVCVVGLAVETNAAIFTVGSASVPQGTGSVTIPISIRGGESITAASIAFGVGDGGPAFGETDIVPITAVVRPATSIFVDAGNPTLTANPELPSSSASIFNIGFTVQNFTTSAEGLIIDVTLNTAALLQGQSFVLQGNIGGVSTLNNGINAVAFSVEDGVLTILPVPEPASLGLLAGAAMFLIRRRRA